MIDPIWFPPFNVVHHYNEIVKSKVLNGDRRYKKIEEAYATAVMLIGIILFQKRDFWMQIVSDKEATPDTRTGCFRLPRGESRNNFITQDIEVVTFEEHSNEKLEDFLLRTKLSVLKKYDEKTTILCYIRKGYYLPPLETLNENLKNLEGGPVMILARIDPEKYSYKIAQIFPAVDFVYNFDLQETIKNFKFEKVLKLKRGLKANLDGKTNEENYPFESLGLIPVRDYAYTSRTKSSLNSLEHS